MKILVLMMSLALFVACGTSQGDKEQGETGSESAGQTETTVDKQTKTDASNDCEQFLDDYEAYVDEVLDVYKKVKENPMDTQNTRKMMEVTQQLAKWSEKWTKLVGCAESDEYVERMEKLQEKVDKVMQE